MKIPAENIQNRFFENIYKKTVSKSNLSVPFDNLDYGRKILENDEECERYIALYGGHHFYKLNTAFTSTNFKFLDGKNVEIIDWGCGQAIATCVLIDYLIENQISPNILKIILVEPSEIATVKGIALINQMFQNEDVSEIIRIINKPLDSLVAGDFETDYENIKVHLFSNMIDVEVFNVKRLYNLIIGIFSGINRFICTSPKNSPKRTARLDEFYKLFSDNYVINLFFESEESIIGEVFIVKSGKHEDFEITRYEKQFSINLPPF